MIEKMSHGVLITTRYACEMPHKSTLQRRRFTGRLSPLDADSVPGSAPAAQKWPVIKSTN